MGRLVLADATVWDAAAGARTATVVVEGSTIAEVAASIEVRPDDRVVPLAGRTVLPGLFSCHFHSSYHELGAKPGPFGLEEPPALQAVRAVNNLGTAVRCGFTSVVSAGAPHGIDAAMKLAVAEGALVGPRITAGSRDLSSTGQANDASFPWYWDVRAAGALRSCDGPDEFRKAVREEVKAGAEIIKLFVTGGHGTLRDPELTEISVDELRAAIDTAHERNVLIRGHIANRRALLDAVAAGIDVVDHGDGMDEECLDRMAEAGTFLVPSQLFPVRLQQVMGGGLGFGQDDATHDASLALLRTAHERGVRILLGDDYGAIGFPHGGYADELDFYVREAGMTPAEVLTWGTANGAALVGRPGLGVVEAGTPADLVVVDGDPLADVGVLRAPERLLGVLVAGSLVTDRLPSAALTGR